MPSKISTSVKKKYKQEYQDYHFKKQQRLEERLLKLDFIIRNTTEMNDLIDKLKK